MKLKQRKCFTLTDADVNVKRQYDEASHRAILS